MIIDNDNNNGNNKNSTTNNGINTNAYFNVHVCTCS